MRAAIVALVLGLAGCVDDNFTPDGDPHGVFELREVKTWMFNRSIVAMDTDGADGAWVIFENANEISHIGPNLTTVAMVPFTNDLPVAGLAHAGDVIWVSYDGGENLLRAFDAGSGELRKSFASETGLADVDVFGDELRYSVIWHAIVGLDAARGGERWRMDYDGECCGIQRGIASMDEDLVWVSTIDERLFLVDRKVGVIGSGLHGMPGGYFDWENSRHLGWNGSHLLIQQDNMIRWLEPVF